jgi:hypothetical protein
MALPSEMSSLFHKMTRALALLLPVAGAEFYALQLKTSKVKYTWLAQVAGVPKPRTSKSLELWFQASVFCQLREMQWWDT